MKAFFLTGSILFTVLLLIVAFENLGLSCSGFLLLFFPIESPFFMVITIAGLGIFSGIFYTGLLMEIVKGKNEEDAPNEW